MTDGHLPTMSSHGQGKDLTLNVFHLSLFPYPIPPLHPLTGIPVGQGPFSQLYLTLTMPTKEAISKQHHIGGSGLHYVIHKHPCSHWLLILIRGNDTAKEANTDQAEINPSWEEN